MTIQWHPIRVQFEWDKNKDRVNRQTHQVSFEEAPEDIAQAIQAGAILPKDFLPPPEQLVLRTAKETMTLRLDADVLEWFRGMGKGYQTKINAVLRAYKGAHEKAEERPQKSSNSQ